MLGWVLRVVLALAVGITIYVIGASMLRKFKVAPPPEPDPDDIKPVNLRFRCTVCGAEVTMTAAQGEDPEPPRHCREDMVLISSCRVSPLLVEKSVRNHTVEVRTFCPYRKNVDRMKPEIRSTSPMTQEVVARLATGEELQVVPADHHDAEGQAREHRGRHPQLARRRLLGRGRRVARAFALRLRHLSSALGASRRAARATARCGAGYLRRGRSPRT